MLTALVLVCSLAVTSDLRSCDIDTAIYVMRVPASFASPTTCLMHGQAYLAQTSLVEGLTADERVKIICMRRGAFAEARR